MSTKSAMPAHLKVPPAWLWKRPLEERIEYYRTQMPEAQYRDYLAGLNDAVNPREQQQGRLM